MKKPSGPLQGIRVLDLTRVWSGPLATRMLADMGAEVIQISSRRFAIPVHVTPEEAKVQAIYPDNDPGEKPWNRRIPENDLSRNKLGLTLELNMAEGAVIFKELVKISDVVIENYSPGVMDRFGLGYPALREVNPKIIMISMPGFGSTPSPYRDYVSYGNALDAFSGLASLAGYPGGPPLQSGTAYPDPTASLHSVSALLIALWHRRRSGKGQFIDMAQSETSSCVMGEVTLGYSLSGKAPLRRGNRSTYKSPQGCYRCTGEDRWVVIEIGSDAEWLAFLKAIGSPAWGKEERFSDQMGRLSNQDELDRLIEEWTTRHPHIEIMHLLQRSGVPAAAVLDVAELFADPHLKARRFLWEIDHPETGPRIYAGLPILMSSTPAVDRMPAPRLGEHNEDILRRLLGLPSEKIRELEGKGVIGTTPLV